VLALAALLTMPAGLVHGIGFGGIPPPTLPYLPELGSLGAAGLGATVGPDNIVVLEPGYTIEPVVTGLSYPASLAFRGDELLVLEMGRYVYAESYDGQDTGNLTAYALDGHGHVLGQRRLATRLADPIGLTVGGDGDVWVSEFGRLSRIPSAWVDQGAGQRIAWSWGYPDQTSDVLFLPVTGQKVNNGNFGFDPLAGSTTGPMGIAIRASDGQPFVAVAAHGRPPDDDGVRDVTHVDYDNPYSSSVIAPTGGALTEAQRAARACRNCYDLAFAPDGRADAGALYITENNGPYRARLFSGSNRSAIAGSSALDVNALDGVDEVDLTSGRIHRVATFRPDLAFLGIAPTGIAFAPEGFAGHGKQMFVALFSGFIPPTDDRGGVDVVLQTDPTTGLGVSQPFIVGLDFPTDVAFGPDGAMYVCEYYNGIVWRIAPTV
jgi:hypothetical protein